MEHQAELNLSYTTITAPVDGTVGVRTLRVGQYVQAGTQLMAVVLLQAAYVVANYKETQLTDVRPGQPVTIDAGITARHTMCAHICSPVWLPRTEEAGPLEHPLAARDHAELAAFVAETKKLLRKITDRALLGRAGLSAHALRNLRKGVPISDKSLFQLVRAAEQLCHETEPIAAVNERWLQKARELLTLVGSQNKLAKLLGVSRPYLGRVLSGERPMTAGMIERLAFRRDYGQRDNKA
jgi:hypothetical protein